MQFAIFVYPTDQFITEHNNFCCDENNAASIRNVCAAIYLTQRIANSELNLFSNRAVANKLPIMPLLHHPGGLCEKTGKTIDLIRSKGEAEALLEIIYSESPQLHPFASNLQIFLKVDSSRLEINFEFLI